VSSHVNRNTAEERIVHCDSKREVRAERRALAEPLLHLICESTRPNVSLQLMAGRSLARQPSCLPPCEPRRHAAADAARRHLVSCGKRRAVSASGSQGVATAE
jgi:hypothetical protein